MKKKLDDDLLLYPCPVMLVTSKYGDKENIFTVSWTGIACSHPEYITISINPKRFSYKLIKNSGCFTANIINQNLINIADYCGTFSGVNHDKFKECKLTKVQGKTIDVPLILECPVNIECKVENILNLGSHHLFIARVLEKLIDENINDVNIHQHLKPVSYIRPNYYSIDDIPLGSFGKTYDLL